MLSQCFKSYGGIWKDGWIYDPKKIGNHEPDWEWTFGGDYVRSPISPKEYFA